MAKIKNPEEGKLSSRINLALPVKLAEDLKTLAFIENSSVNDYARRILAAYVDACNDDLEKYKNFIEQMHSGKSNAGTVTIGGRTIGRFHIPRIIPNSATDDEISKE